MPLVVFKKAVVFHRTSLSVYVLKVGFYVPTFHMLPLPQNKVVDVLHPFFCVNELFCGDFVEKYWLEIRKSSCLGLNNKPLKPEFRQAVTRGKDATC